MRSRLPLYFHVALLSLPIASCASFSPPSSSPALSKDVSSSGKGIALAIGLNYLSTAHYPSDGRLTGCESDAEDLTRIARSQGFEATALPTKKATRGAIRRAIKSAQQTLKKGDTFVIAFSGHGGKALDTNGDETDGQDETWCLFDGQIVDDEMAQWWSGFNDGVRILQLSDSCHSGTVLKIFDGEGEEIPDPASGTKAFTNQQMEKLFKMPENQQLDKDLPREGRSKGITSASVVLISACQDDEEAKDAQDGNRNSVFTARLLSVWANGSYQGSLTDYYDKVSRGMPGDQNPNLDRTGKRDRQFEAQRPWTK